MRGLAYVLLTATAHAQPVPPFVTGILNAPGTGPVVQAPDVDRSTLHADTRVENGVRIVTVPRDYLNLIRELAKQGSAATSVDAGSFSDLQNICGCRVTRVVPESRFRKTYIFSDRDGPMVALTLWNYERDGAVVRITADQVNGEVNGYPASISLGEVPSSRPGLWKVGWFRGAAGDRALVELYAWKADALAFGLAAMKQYALAVENGLR